MPDPLPPEGAEAGNVAMIGVIALAAVATAAVALAGAHGPKARKAPAGTGAFHLHGEESRYVRDRQQEQ